MRYYLLFILLSCTVLHGQSSPLSISVGANLSEWDANYFGGDDAYSVNLGGQVSVDRVIPVNILSLDNRESIFASLQFSGHQFTEPSYARSFTQLNISLTAGPSRKFGRLTTRILIRGVYAAYIHQKSPGYTGSFPRNLNRISAAILPGLDYKLNESLAFYAVATIYSTPLFSEEASILDRNRQRQYYTLRTKHRSLEIGLRFSLAMKQTGGKF